MGGKKPLGLSWTLEPLQPALSLVSGLAMPHARSELALGHSLGATPLHQNTRHVLILIHRPP
jgi:hypothetical protein